MRAGLLLALFVAAAVCVAACVTEPAPPDNTVFGHVDPPKKAKKQKRSKAPPKVEEATAESQ